MEGLKNIPMVFLILGITAIIAGAGMLTTSKFGETMTRCYNASYCYNATTGMCTSNNTLSTTCDNENAGTAGTSGAALYNFSEQYYVLQEGKDGQSAVAEQFPTIGIVAAMVIIIGLLMGLFVYTQYFR